MRSINWKTPMREPGVRDKLLDYMGLEVTEARYVLINGLVFTYSWSGPLEAPPPSGGADAITLGKQAKRVWTDAGVSPLTGCPPPGPVPKKTLSGTARTRGESRC